ncbi:hypothetical protein MXB_4369 [Myxobolus squamalis]|nr:hypothetical protein MXB_4369 [Myxobolus squamalis]
MGYSVSLEQSSPLTKGEILGCTSSKLSLDINALIFTQIACPRLSIDWGGSYSKPLLNTYEMSVVLGAAQWQTEQYPSDYYTKNSLGPWTPNYSPSIK